MTFIKKSSEELIKNYEDLAIMIKGYIKIPKSDFTSPLAEVFVFLDKVSQLEDTESDAQRSNILYGALLAAKNYVKNHQSSRSLPFSLPLPSPFPMSPESYFLGCVEDLLKPSTANSSSLNKAEEFIFYSELNNYLNILFENKNSSLGLKSTGNFSFEDPARLDVIRNIILQSYTKECELTKKIPKPSSIDKKLETSKLSSSNLLYDFDKLSKALHDLKLDEIASKGRVNISDLNRTRAMDLTLLDLTIQILTNTGNSAKGTKQSKKSFKKDPEPTVDQNTAFKSITLASICLLIRESIVSEYHSYQPFAPEVPTTWIVGTSSLVAKGLTRILNLENPNKINTSSAIESEPSKNSLDLSTGTAAADKPIRDLLDKLQPSFTTKLDLPHLSTGTTPHPRHTLEESKESNSTEDLGTHTPSSSTATSTTAISNATPAVSSIPALAPSKASTTSETKEIKAEPNYLMPLESALELIEFASDFLLRNLKTLVEAKPELKEDDIFTLLNLAQKLKQCAREQILNKCVDKRMEDLKARQAEVSKQNQTPGAEYKLDGLLGLFGLMWKPKTTQTSSTTSDATPSPLSMNPSGS